jgi:ribonuclease HI
MKLIVFADGSIQGGNPGGHAVGGWVLQDLEDTVVAVGCHDLEIGPDRTNNQAEYAGVWAALKYVTDVYDDSVELLVKSDSKLVVNQIQGHWNCANPILDKWRQRIWDLEKSLKRVKYRWIPRAKNSLADSVSRFLYTAKPLSWAVPVVTREFETSTN